MTRMSRERGFTLVEMLVAVAVGSVVLVFVFSTFFGSQRATVMVSEQIENRQNGRTALQLLERDLRMAGSGWSRMAVQGGFKGNPMQVLPITPGYGGSLTANDSVVAFGAWDATTTLRAVLQNPGNAIKVVSAAGFADDDFVVVTNGQTAHMFQVTKVASGPNLSCGSSSPYNSGHIAWPSGGYPTGTSVYRASWVFYRVESTAAGRFMLVRRDAGDPDQVVAQNISHFKVSYLLQDGSVTRDPEDPLTIERLVPVVSTLLDVPNRAPMEDSALVSIRPRSF